MKAQALIAIALLSAAVPALWAWGEHRERQGRQAESDSYSETVRLATKAWGEAEQRARATEQAWQKSKQEADHALSLARTAAARTLAAVRAVRTERDGLRDQIVAYAAGSGLTAPDTVAACRARAADISAALDDALRAGEERTAQAVDLADSVRALRAAWPVNEE